MLTVETPIVFLAWVSSMELSNLSGRALRFSLLDAMTPSTMSSVSVGSDRKEPLRYSFFLMFVEFQ